MNSNRRRRGVFWLLWALGMLAIVAALVLLRDDEGVAAAGSIASSPAVVVARVRHFLENLGGGAPNVGGALSAVISGIAGMGESVAGAVGGVAGSLGGASAR